MRCDLPRWFALVARAGPGCVSHVLQSRRGNSTTRLAVANLHQWMDNIVPRLGPGPATPNDERLRESAERGPSPLDHFRVPAKQANTRLWIKHLLHWR